MCVRLQNGVVVIELKKLNKSANQSGHVQLSAAYYTSKLRRGNWRVSGLVAAAFLGKKPAAHPPLVVDHINHDSLCNHPYNLRYISCAHNLINSTKLSPPSCPRAFLLCVIMSSRSSAR